MKSVSFFYRNLTNECETRKWTHKLDMHIKLD